MDVLVCFSAFIFCLLLVVSGGIVRPSEAKAESVLLLAVCPDTQSIYDYPCYVCLGAYLNAGLKSFAK